MHRIPKMSNLMRYLRFSVHGETVHPRSPRRRPRTCRRGPVRDRKYLAWIRSLPCCHCGATRDVEAAHTGSDGGMRQKASDTSCVPLCHDCHQSAAVSYHRNRKELGIDFPALAAQLNAEYGVQL